MLVGAAPGSLAGGPSPAAQAAGGARRRGRLSPQVGARGTWGSGGAKPGLPGFPRIPAQPLLVCL